MRRVLHLLFISLFALSFTSCENKEKQADKLTEEFMRKNLNDPRSYQLVERGRVDSLFSEFRATAEAQYMLDKVKQITDSATRYSASVKTISQAQQLLADGQRILQDYKKKQQTFKRQFLGYAYRVSFRAKNDHGVPVRSYVVFRLSPEMDKVSIEDADMNIFTIFAAEAINDNITKY
jgi:hypothetical protein